MLPWSGATREAPRHRTADDLDCTYDEHSQSGWDAIRATQEFERLRSVPSRRGHMINIVRDTLVRRLGVHN